MISTTTMASPVGELVLGASDRGLRFVLWPGERRRLDLGPDGGPDGGPDTDAARVARERILDDAVAQLEEYFAGTRTEFDLPLDPVGTAFQRSAWDVLRTIPYAGTMSYGEQARALGDPNKARAVGAANGKNPISIVVPCHRVVGANGALTGFAGGIESKAWLLDHERRVIAST